jgi:hypothetical protein
VAELEALSRLGPHAEHQPVLSARQYRRDRVLLHGVRHHEAQAFVLDQISYFSPGTASTMATC